MSLTVNKIAAAGLTAGVIAMTAGLIGNLIIVPPGYHHGEEKQFAYVIEGSGAPVEAAAVEEPGIEPILALLADADVEAGQRRARACTACHAFEAGGPNKVGPNLWNIVNAPKAQVPGFSYTDALAGIAEPWGYHELNLFIADPRAYAPGTKMSYGGMRNVNHRAELIAWMRTRADSPAPLPTEEEINAAAGAASE